MKKEKIVLDMPSRDTRTHQELGGTTSAGTHAKVACRRCGTVSPLQTKPTAPIFDCRECGGVLCRVVSA